MTRNNSKDLTVGSPTRLILGFSLPLLLGMLFQQVYSLMDTIIVGRFLSVSALAAVGSTGSICFLIIGFCQGVCAGFSLPIAQRFGAKDEKGLKKYVGNAGIVSVIIAITMTALTVLLCGQILTWMNTPSDIYDLAYQYLIVIFAGIPATILYNMLSGYLRSLGNSVIPVIFLIIAAVLNIGFDLLFILVFNMGVFGAAFATVLSQCISGVLCIIYIAKNVPLLHVSRNDLELDSSYVRNLMIMGLPMGFQYSITAIGSVILQTAVNGLGSIAVASMTAASRISMFVMCPFDALGSTMATYSGQNVGAAKFKRVKKGLISASVIGSIYSVLIFVALLFIANYLIYLFVSPSETEVVAQAHQFLLTSAFFYIPLVLVNTVRFTIQGMGFSGFAMFAGTDIAKDAADIIDPTIKSSIAVRNSFLVVYFFIKNAVIKNTIPDTRTYPVVNHWTIPAPIAYSAIICGKATFNAVSLSIEMNPPMISIAIIVFPFSILKILSI